MNYLDYKSTLLCPQVKFQEQDFVFQIFNIKVDGVKAMDWNGKSDPFVTMYWIDEANKEVLGTKQQTEAKLKCLSASYESEHTFVLPLDRPFVRPQAKPKTEEKVPKECNESARSPVTSSTSLTVSGTVATTSPLVLQPSASPLSLSGPPRPKQTIPIAIIATDQLADCDGPKELTEGEATPKKASGGRKLSAPERPNGLAEKPGAGLIASSPLPSENKPSFLPPQLRKLAQSAEGANKNSASDPSDRSPHESHCDALLPSDKPSFLPNQLRKLSASSDAKQPSPTSGGSNPDKSPPETPPLFSSNDKLSFLPPQLRKLSGSNDAKQLLISSGDAEKSPNPQVETKYDKPSFLPPHLRKLVGSQDPNGTTNGESSEAIGLTKKRFRMECWDLDAGPDRQNFIGGLTLSASEFTSLVSQANRSRRYRRGLHAKEQVINTSKPTGVLQFEVKIVNLPSAKLHVGKPLAQSISLCKETSTEHILDACLEKLHEEDSLATVGIIRIPGQKDVITRCLDDFDNAVPVSFATSDPLDVAGVLKKYLMSLPETLATAGLWESVKGLDFEGDIAGSLSAVKAALAKLPPPHLSCMRKLFTWFDKLQERAEVNKMTANAITISIGPTILIPTDVIADPNLFVAANGLCQQTMNFLLTHFADLGLSTDEVIQAVSSKKLLAAKSLALNQSAEAKRPVDEAQEYAVGQRVEVLERNNDSATLPATIESWTPLDGYRILLDTGDTLTGYRNKHVRSLAHANPASLAEGVKILSLYSDGHYYPARISAVNEDGTYNVEYDEADSDKEANIDILKIKLAEQ